MAVDKAAVMSKVSTIASWSTNIINFATFQSAVNKYFNRAGTEFATQFYTAARYELALEFMQGLIVEFPEHFPPTISERPDGFSDIRDLMIDAVADRLFEEILSVSQTTFKAANVSNEAMPPQFKNTLLEKWATGIEAALTRQASKLSSLAGWCENEYMKYFNALVENKQGRAWEWYVDNNLTLVGDVFESRQLGTVMSDYGLTAGVPEGLAEVRNGDSD